MDDDADFQQDHAEDDELEIAAALAAAAGEADRALRAQASSKRQQLAVAFFSILCLSATSDC
jgi:hypothetical protein